MQKGELHRLLSRVYRTHYRRSFAEFSKFGITQGQPRILNFLARADGCMQRELAEHCNIEPATVTSALGTMERDGLIARLPDAADRRVTRVFLTDKGRDAQRRVMAVFGALEDECFRGFSEDEREQAMRLLSRMHANMKAGEGGGC